MFLNQCDGVLTLWWFSVGIWIHSKFPIAFEQLNRPSPNTSAWGWGLFLIECRGARVATLFQRAHHARRRLERGSRSLHFVEGA
jgi:hypothetical protein